jgi:hypothetical protein
MLLLLKSLQVMTCEINIAHRRKTRSSSQVASAYNVFSEYKLESS